MINERSNRVVVDGGGGESVAKSHRCHCHLSLSLGVVCARECLEFMKRFLFGGGEWV